MTRRNASSLSSINRGGGVNIGQGANVSVGGDLVGRDKITQAVVEKELATLFDQLQKAIHKDGALTQNQKDDLLAKSKELESELKKSNPDLGTLERLKQFLSSHGKTIAAAVSASFQYPAVQESIKTPAQKLIGG